MGRYTGPVEKLSRREGVELYLKGERALNGKSLQTDFDALTGKVLRIPERAEISAAVDEHLIVELYSRL